MIARDDLVGVAIISGVFAVILIAAEVWRRTGGAKPEWSRKLVHVGGGLTALSLPFLIRSPFVVLLLTVTLSAIFFLGGRTGLLQSVHGVERTSRGSEYYPLAIFVVFVISSGRTWLFICAILVLAVADAFAALIGSRYGQLRYEVEDEFKSVEGSLVFLVIAFLALHLPMLLMTDLAPAVTVLSALLVAMLVTGFEAISLRGTDNLFIPIAVCFVLAKITTKPVSEIAYQNVSFILIFAVLGLVAWKFRSFNTGGMIAIVLFTFATWSLGSRRWSLPVMLALAAFVIVRAALAGREGDPLRVRVITHAIFVPFLVLLAANLTGRYGFFFAPYVMGTVMVLALVWWDGRIRLGLFPKWGDATVAGAIGAVAALVIGLPVWMMVADAPSFTTLRVITVTAVLIAAVNAFLVKMHLEESSPRGWSGVSFLLALTAASLVAILQQAGMIEAFPR